ncbi:unnamed protein product (macronuclear) [Paramecium tetraurelia]|uniref:Uncharacterized protein n=1 Tax=Paramecium tetraurelia TaxID=5888 RepID=A0C6H7_PARTE|nr:uncharacterized protein GSPATT00035523001 [Paramecium tetraurelia]CAK66394.1 unnamed protein product [Paramecium tetraurelia]|eukprot:XP_001433791.1 hypothetical protein (macronuclear) [Paramecium tetraurelia strain d4-2]
MDQTNHEMLELKMVFLTCMKNSNYQEAHLIIQKFESNYHEQVLKIDPYNPQFGKYNRFQTEFKTILEKKKKN